MSASPQGPETPVAIGEIIAAKYRVDRILGAGAMGVVVAVTHVDLNERRAIKFMLPSALHNAAGVERFLREARAAVRLKSQHVARIHDVGRLDTGAPYMVMEYLEGTDLKAMLEAKGTFSAREAVWVLLQACEALNEAHALGIVHRDLKPANLFLTRGANNEPVVKVLDFGIAKVADGDEGALEMTKTSDLLGTPLYMSPEQMRSTRNVDARSDIWSLGVVLYRMLTGKAPFAGTTVTEICSAVIADAPDPPSTLKHDIPPALEGIVLRCLEKDPGKRFATAKELAGAAFPFAMDPAALAAHTASVNASHLRLQPFGGPVAAPTAMRTHAAPMPAAAASSLAGSGWTQGGNPPGVGHSTAGGASWTHSGAALPHQKSNAPRIVALTLVGVAVVAGGVAFGARYAGQQTAGASPGASATASAVVEASARSSASASASAVPAATAAAAPTPAPSPSGEATATPPAAPSPPPAAHAPGRPAAPAGRKPSGPSKPRSGDAFGEDRK